MQLYLQLLKNKNKMKKVLSLKNIALMHKKTSILVAIVLLIVGYYSYKSLTSTASEVRYVTGSVEKGTIVSSITGTGQVGSAHQIDLKAKGSGDVVFVATNEGQDVKAGTLLVSLDATDARKNVRDAEVSLQSAQISLDKLKAPADKLTMVQAENALSSATESRHKAYDDGINTISGTYLDLPSVMSGLQDIVYGTTVSRGVQDNLSAYADMVKMFDDGKITSYKTDVSKKYILARASYDKSFADYKASSRFSDASSTETLINDTYDSVKIIADSVKSTNDMLNYVKDVLTQHNLSIPSYLTTHQNLLNSYTSQTNSHLLDLYNIKSSISSANRTIVEKNEQLDNLKTGADALDLESAELSVKQRENALLDAKETLSNYYIVAPFDGTVAKIKVKKADSVSSGTAVATFITKQMMATITLNEVDVAKVKVGQRATMTFDAIDELTITGKVTSVDTVGTVSQGVVTYTVEIGLDTDDQRIKPGMSVSASIITDVKQDTLLVPNSAVKSSNGSYYVEMFSTPLISTSSTTPSLQGTPSKIAPNKITVEVGISNDSDTEIISGVKEGDQVVTKTVNPSTTITTSSQTPSLFGNMRTGGNSGTRSTTSR